MQHNKYMWAWGDQLNSRGLLSEPFSYELTVSNHFLCSLEACAIFVVCGLNQLSPFLLGLAPSKIAASDLATWRLFVWLCGFDNVCMRLGSFTDIFTLPRGFRLLSILNINIAEQAIYSYSLTVCLNKNQENGPDAQCFYFLLKLISNFHTTLF